eukprot:GHVN01065231.1.p1 GENE.GHVN01065231.1~~GHVN01065231.1.p1  ORF type:complete len:450 (+),score=69.94 GHVN01065231.1:241-1590(+)
MVLVCPQLTHVTPYKHNLIRTLYAPETDPCNEIQILRRELSLEAYSEEVLEQLLQVWVHNCFEDKDDPVGYILVFMVSFCSHSCVPNAMWYLYEDSGFVLRARRPVSKGEELSLSYLAESALFQPCQVRERFLLSTKGFKCTCPRCVTVLDASRGLRCPECLQGTVFLSPKAKQSKGSEKKKETPTNVEVDTLPKDFVERDLIFTPEKFSVLDKFNSVEPHKLSETDVEPRLLTGKADACVECGHVLATEQRDCILQKEKRLIRYYRKLSGDSDEEECSANESSPPESTSTSDSTVGQDVQVHLTQHWAKTKWLNTRVTANKHKKNYEEAALLEARKLAYLLHMHPAETGHFAWCLEDIADCLIKSRGLSKLLGSDVDVWDPTLEHSQEIVTALQSDARIVPSYRLARSMLARLFGEENENTQQVRQKLDTLKAYFRREVGEGASAASS